MSRTPVPEFSLSAPNVSTSHAAKTSARAEWLSFSSAACGLSDAAPRAALCLLRALNQAARPSAGASCSSPQPILWHFPVEMKWTHIRCSSPGSFADGPAKCLLVGSLLKIAPASAECAGGTSLTATEPKGCGAKAPLPLTSRHFSTTKICSASTQGIGDDTDCARPTTLMTSPKRAVARSRRIPSGVRLSDLQTAVTRPATPTVASSSSRS
mmetsp:Transcript_4315/g.10459  ORF Transcript_4315/g.10459 Transcript_4315/m.10459 type:complete len:212 (+) Transcript_4315:809-1444(+)